MKFHINNKGTPAACTATINKCPYGGAGSHYTKEDADLICKVQNELNHGLINSSRKNIKKAETDEELKYVEIRKNALIANGIEMNEPTYVEKITSSIQLKNFSPKVIESHHFKVERETRNEIIEDIGKGKVVGDFECETKVKDANSTQIYRIYDSGYVEIYKQNVKDKKNGTHTLVTAYIFKKSQLEAVFLNGGHVVSSEWLDDVANNNKKMKKELKNKTKEEKQKELEVEPEEKQKDVKNISEDKKQVENSKKEKINPPERNEVELSEEERERRRIKNAKRRQRKRANARRRKSEAFSKEQIENERTN